ncbi:GntR family transcriptional regulator [Aquabacterium lacunae]|jgi:DNA-binding GntR family transcriptional regulator|uniref:GntR family transcriptional regulator n=1 Tax=Aquabacterium lacunae TaxID=2528630 RepID=A0A4Q9GVH9_9BURK|nr:GntR family transcriptional regulator [Aquabacterium lacunae]TBO27876.1 GntR family transcriptional regulator [Aquabacterium lacunae]
MNLPAPAFAAPSATERVAPSAFTLAERAYAEIKQLIFDFQLLPGDRFSESDLAQRVQVSRTPLRQALQRLQREGFLQVFPKSGWRVSPLDFEAFDQLYDLRVLLECHAVARLCEMEERPTLKALAHDWLVPEAERLQAALPVDRLDETFHHALVQATGNQEMVRVHADITERIRIIRRLDFTQRRRVDATYDEHARILRAITRRRSDEAQRLLRAHIEQSKLEVRHITLDMLYQARQRAQAAP